MSFGVESSTMGILYGKGAKLLFVDTGSEHKELYARIDKYEKFIMDFHKGDCELIRLRGNYKTKGIVTDSLTEAIEIGQYMPSGQARFCTRVFKIEPIDNYLKGKEAELLIGFNLDEEGRTGNLEKLININYRYPLIEDGYTREDCEAILEFHGMHPSFPVYMSRGGCKFCFFKSEKEYKAMYYLDRETFNEVRDLENKIQDKRPKHFSIMSNQKSMNQLERECKQEIPFDYTEIYKEVEKKTYCGAFCHR